MKKFFKKSLGQNFLIDKNIIKKIVNLVDIKKKNVIEIGPGSGALTDEIIKKKPKQLILFEKDFKLVEKLKLKYLCNNFVKIYQSDILKIDIEKKINKNTVVFGNLPYNISSQILVKFLKFKKWPPRFNDVIFMFQKELGEKIICKYPSKNYGRISILTNYRFDVLNKFYISPNCFFPRPKVNSMIIHFYPKKKILKNININNLEKVTNIIFSNKRKMINKNIKKIISYQKIKNIPGLSIEHRPTEIRPEIYYKITELFEKG